jgi:hypothetical protein
MTLSIGLLSVFCTSVISFGMRPTKHSRANPIITFTKVSLDLKVKQLYFFPASLSALFGRIS